MDVGQLHADRRAVSGPSATRRGASAIPATICFPFVGGSVGGSHISAAKLIEALDRSRFRPLIVLHDTRGPLAEMLSAMGLAFERAPVGPIAEGGPSEQSAGSFLRLIRHARPLARFLREKGVDIVHTNDGLTHASWGVPAKLAGSKLVWHHRGNPNARGVRFLAPFIADRLVSVSRFAAPRPGLISAASRTHVIHSPFDADAASLIDRAACRAAALAELSLPCDTQILGFFGHFAARKRPLAFVEAIAALRRIAPEAPVAGLIFGEERDPGLEREIVSLIGRLGLEDHVRMMGFRYPGEPWIGACDQLVVPAVEEPFGRTLIEAMLLGTPVIAAASGGNIEAIKHGETGLLAPPDDPEAMARAVLGLIRDPGAATRIAANAKAHALSTFGVERHAEAVSAIYDGLLGA